MISDFSSDFSSLFQEVLSEEDFASVDFSNLSSLFVAVMLDGKTLPSNDNWTEIYLYANLATNMVLNTPSPKGGFKESQEI